MREYKPEEHYHVPGDGSWWVKDARGIEIARVCDGCKSVKLAGYRRDIFTNALYQAEEPIDDE